MPLQLVMDHSGDTRHWYDATDERSLSEAKERFRQLAERGYIAAVREKEGSSRIIRSFEPTAEETLFFPRLVGG
jgi:SOS-response transcriptional repressor LexA